MIERPRLAAASLGSALLLLSCGGGGALEPSQIGTALTDLRQVAGQSLSDLWASTAVVDANGAPVVGVGHTTGKRLWQIVDVPHLKDTTGGFASAGAGAVWLSGIATASMAPSVVRVHTSGAIDDFTADMPMGASTLGKFSMSAGAGGVFVTLSTEPSGGEPVAHLLRFQNEHFTEVPAFPSALEATVLAVVGPDEAYLYVNAPPVPRLVHYAAGKFTDVPWANGSNTDQLVIAASPADVWVQSGLTANATLLHGDGASWTPITLSGWPSGVDLAGPFVALPSGFAVFAHKTTGTQGAGELDALHFAPDGHLTSDGLTAACAASDDCRIDARSFARLDDGTLLLIDDSLATWFVGSVSAL